MTAEDRRERCCKCAGPVEDEVMCFPAPRLCIACMPTPTPLAGTCAPVAEDRREYRERVLRERAERIASHLYMLPGYEELWQAILAALRQTAEEEREAAYSDWDLRANAAYAQGERAGREAEREACARMLAAAAEDDLVSQEQRPPSSVPLRYAAAAIRARGAVGTDGR